MRLIGRRRRERERAFAFLTVGGLGVCILFLLWKLKKAKKIIEEQKRKENRLFLESNMDKLTGCYNRRAYERDLQRMSVEKAFAYILVDINGLKTINDTLGHAAGDELILGAAFCLKQCFGKLGKVYRIGGDEFVVLLSKKDCGACEKEEEFQRRVEAWRGSLVQKLSVSYGAVWGEEKNWCSMAEVAKEADKRMYRKKALYYSREGTDRRR